MENCEILDMLMVMLKFDDEAGEHDDDENYGVEGDGDISNDDMLIMNYQLLF